MTDTANSYYTFKGKDAESCYWQIRTIRRNYIPHLGLNAPTLLAATEAASELWHKNPTLPPVPMPIDIDCPRQQDFFELEQWFYRVSTTATLIDAETNRHKWQDDAPDYQSKADALKIADGKVTEKKLRDHLRTKGNTIRWMYNEKSHRCKVHRQDWKHFWKILQTTDPFSEAAFKKMEERKEKIRQNPLE